MALQDSKDWEFSLTQLSKVPIQLSQPLTSRQYLRDEEEPFKRHVQPRLDFDPQQKILRNLRNL